MFRSRIAPTPSGYLHLGNVYNFLLTWLYVRKNKGKLVLRIDDLDNERFRMAYVDDIFATLEWLQITYDEGATSSTDFVQNHSQRYRITHYNNLLEQLINTQKVYACDCSRSKIQSIQPTTNYLYPLICTNKKISLHQKDVTWRIHIPPTTQVSFKDEKNKTITLSPSQIIGDFVIRKRDGLPAYQIASLVDDLFYKINYIVRGKDLLASTSVQLYLAQELQLNDFQQVKFIHHKLVLDQTGKKLSKSQEAPTIKDVRTIFTSPTPIYQSFAQWLDLPSKDIVILDDLLELFLKSDSF